METSLVEMLSIPSIPTTPLNFDCFSVSVSGGANPLQSNPTLDLVSDLPGCLNLGSLSKMTTPTLASTQGISLQAFAGSDLTFQLLGVSTGLGSASCTGQLLLDLLNTSNPGLYSVGSTNSDLFDNGTSVSISESPTWSNSELIEACLQSTSDLNSLNLIDSNNVSTDSILRGGYPYDGSMPVASPSPGMPFTDVLTNTTNQIALKDSIFSVSNGIGFQQDNAFTMSALIPHYSNLPTQPYEINLNNNSVARADFLIQFNKKSTGVPSLALFNQMTITIEATAGLTPYNGLTLSCGSTITAGTGYTARVYLGSASTPTWSQAVAFTTAYDANETATTLTMNASGSDGPLSNLPFTEYTDNSGSHDTYIHLSIRSNDATDIGAGGCAEIIVKSIKVSFNRTI